MGNSASSLPALQTVANCETSKFMGTWFVVGVKPTMFEKTCSNAVERYTLVHDKNHDVDIDFQYNNKEAITSPLKSLPQKGWVQGNKENSGVWKVSPTWPIKMPYMIIECDDNYEYCVIGYPTRDYCWIMNRKPIMDDSTYEKITKQLEEKHQYDLKGLRKVPQTWTKEERANRGLTQEISDDMLIDK